MSTNNTHVNPTLLRTELGSLSVEQRADLLEKVVRAFYDGSKFDYPGGAGLDGRDGQERNDLAPILSAAIDFHDNSRRAASSQQP